jgi:hypothetical protein
MQNEDHKLSAAARLGVFFILHPTFCISWRGGRVVYCGGLENRFGLTADGGSNPSLSAILITKV